MIFKLVSNIRKTSHLVVSLNEIKVEKTVDNHIVVKKRVLTCIKM